jgi:4-hydroxybutyrate CoA-transferase
MSRRGRAITLMPSVARGGVSTIVPQFDAGQIVSIPRELADTVVTDQGIARLLGKSVRERAEELIGAAHPDHRDWLHDEARRLFG